MRLKLILLVIKLFYWGWVMGP